MAAIDDRTGFVLIPASYSDDQNLRAKKKASDNRGSFESSEELVKLGSTVRFALALVLGLEGFQPHLVVARVLEYIVVGMTHFMNAQELQGFLEGYLRYVLGCFR